MADGSHIEWTDATWNPLVGCTKVSPGCDNCYAEGEVTRRHAAALSPKTSPKMLEAFPAPFSTVSVRPNRFLLQPLAWTKPRRIFVNSLSDLFHADVPDDFIAQVFAVMALAPQHTFQLLTKRHARMRSLLNDDGFRSEVAHEINGLITVDGVPEPDYLSSYDDWWPLPHVWLGVSVEDQQWAEIRIPALLDTPAAVRWISAEPLLGPLNLRPYLTCPHDDETGVTSDERGWTGRCRGCGALIRTEPDPHNSHLSRMTVLKPGKPDIAWVVTGGESGPGARPMHPDWARDLRDQCARVDVPFLFKQWGEWTPDRTGQHRVTKHRSRYEVKCLGPKGEPWTNETYPSPAWAWVYRKGKRAAGRELDGRTHDDYPDMEMTHA